MITDQCREMLNKFGYLEEKDKIKSDMDYLNARKDELEQLNQGFGLIVEKTETLFARNLIKPHEIPELATTIEVIQKIKNKLRKSPRKLTEGKDYDNVLNQLHNSTKEILSALKLAWDNFTQSQFKERPLDMLNTIKNEPQFEHLVQKIVDSTNSLQKIRREVPSSQDQILGLEDTFKKLSEAWASLPMIDQEVELFIQKANSNSGATLNMLTPKVSDWLRQNSMSDSYGIFRRKGNTRVGR